MNKGMLALGVMWAVLISIGLASAGEDKNLFLGVYVDEVTSKVANDYGVDVGGGVLVSGTVDGSPADEVGLRANDILLKLDGKRLTGPAELRLQIQEHEAGDKVDLTYKRGGKQKTVSVELVERGSHRKSWFSDDDHHLEWMPEPGLKIHKKFRHEKDKKVAFAGIVTQELSEGLETYFKVEDGALISEVVEDSPAEAAGLKAGDVIVKIGSKDIDDTGDVSKAIHKYDPGDEVDFVIYRDGKEKTIKVKLTSRQEHYGADDDAIHLFGDAIIISPGDCEEDLKEIFINLEGILDHIDLEDLDDELEKLGESLEDIHIEFESIPDVNMDLSIDPVAPFTFQMNLNEARAISGNSWWKRSWNDMKHKLEEDLERLKASFDSLKVELEQLKQEFKERML